MQRCNAEAAVFMGSGREDMDVRMLGSGRPFLLQVRVSLCFDSVPYSLDRLS